jgi:hypothetical protein
MNEHDVRPGEMVGACLLLGGCLLAAFPGYALSILRVVLVTLAAGAALYALAVHVPPTGWMSPFKWMSPFGKPVRPREDGTDGDTRDLASIRSKLRGWRYPGSSVPPMPPAVIAILKPVIRTGLESPRTHGRPPGLAGRRGSMITWAMLDAEPPRGLDWLRMLPPKEEEVAEVVHAVLDDLDARDREAPDPPHDSNHG